MGMYDEAVKKTSNSGKFLKLEQGDNRIRILGHPYVSARQFREGDPVRNVFSWPVWNYDAEKVQILEKGPGVFKPIAAIVKQWGEQMPMNCDLVITMSGSGLDTEYEIVAVPHSGTMPGSALAEMPNLEDEIKGGVPLENFIKAERLDVQKQKATNDAINAKDIVIEDLDDETKVNLDDIPF